MSEPKLPVGTRIKFTKTLACGPTGDHPALLFANEGDAGEIVRHNDVNHEGYMVKVDWWPHPFGASPDEFELLNAERDPRTIDMFSEQAS